MEAESPEDVGVVVFCGRFRKVSIQLSDQSINGLYCRSQLYPKTSAAEESRVVTKNVEARMSPDGKRMERLTARVIQVLEVPSIRCSCRGGIA